MKLEDQVCHCMLCKVGVNNKTPYNSFPLRWYASHCLQLICSCKRKVLNKIMYYLFSSSNNNNNNICLVSCVHELKD